MLFTTIAHDYFRWHYSAAFREMFHLWLNFLWFTIHFFSIPQLSRSLFSPWKRMTESRGNSWSFEDIAGYVIINVLSRFIGALLRSIIIAVGLLTLIILIVLGGIVYLFWIIAPAGLLIMLATGITLLVSNLI